MRRGFYSFQKWVTTNRLLAWWSLFLPAIALLLLLTKKDLIVTEEVLNDAALSFQDKVLNAPSLVIMVRALFFTACLVGFLICLLLPVFRVSRTGVQWTKELEEELTKASSEITAEEVGLLIKEEANRWNQVLQWMNMKRWQKGGSSVILRELLGTLWESFPGHNISVTLADGDEIRALTHPLLPWLTKESEPEEDTIGFRISFSGVRQLSVLIYSRDEEGFSSIDESYLLIMGHIFSRIIEEKKISTSELIDYFQVDTLTNGE